MRGVKPPHASRQALTVKQPRLSRFARAMIVLALLGVAAAIGIAVDEPHGPVIERDVVVKMRDGVTLRADVYHPRADGRFPVLLTRTPYDKSNSLDVCMRAVAAGYACVAEDCRGRWASEGEWYPFKHESEDGYDTVEWFAHQPYSTGMIGMWGASYVGATQLLAALAHPPHLAGLFAVVTASNYHENWTYQGGAFQQWFAEEWTSELSEDTLRRRVPGGEHPLEWANVLPLADYPVINAPDAKDLAPYFQDWLAHSEYDDYWRQWAIDADYSRINVPVFHVGGWYDIFLGGTLRNYLGIKAGGGNLFTRENQRLLIEVGGHAGAGRKVGDVDFGPNADWNETGLMLRWYDFLLKGSHNGVATEKPVRVFTMGPNQWRDFVDWPPPGAQPQRFFLHSTGKANSSAGDGALIQTLPAAESSDHYVYDPANPVPTRGGPLCCNKDLLATGPQDQTDIERRNDILIYTTEPLAEAMNATGPVSAELYVQSSAEDTDFTSKLVDLWPNGFEQNITEGILRMRYRNSTVHAEKIQPGQTYKIRIDMWATSNVFAAGHCIRLEVSSSNFPRFDRNLNTGETAIAHATRKVVATNTLLHDAAHPSALVLTVLPNQ